MEVMGICSICGRSGKMYTCMTCGRLVCSRCMDTSKGVCVQCSHAGRHRHEKEGIFR